MTEPFKTYRCGCTSPVRGRIMPCKFHTGPGVPRGTAMLQNQRLYRQSVKAKNTLRERPR